MAAGRIRKALNWAFALFAIPAVALIIFIVNLIWFRPFNIDHFYERVFIEVALDDPELLTSLRIVEQFGVYGHNAKLTDPSHERAMRSLEKAERDLATLRSYDRERQTDSQLLSTDILDWFIDNSVRGEPFMYHGYPVNQMNGVQNSLPSFLANSHAVNSEEDAEHYLSRLELFDWKMGLVMEGLKAREAREIVPPRFVIQRVLDEMRGFTGAPATENILYTSFEEKLNKADDIPETQRDSFLKGAESRINDFVYPAYHGLIAYFEELLPKVETDHGVWALPNGEAYYAWRLRSNTTTDLSPDQVHNIGLAEVERIDKEMRAILDGLGHNGGGVSEWMLKLSAEPRFLFPNTDEGREEALEGFRTIIEEARPRLDPLFDVLPKAEVTVERVPEFREKTAASYYSSPAMDGSRPGTFFAKLYDMNDVAKFGMRTLVYHEAIPGHHFQIALQQEMTGVPTFRKVLPFTAYTEGWALYAEFLAREEGFHGDPYSELGQMQSEMFRAVRLVVDTGIHQKRWTREEAIEYMVGKTGMTEGEVTSEIERYFVVPGQACAYKMGMLKILELRERARAELGDRFDIREFHNTVQLTGAVPLEILERVVDGYIASKKSAD